MTPAGTFPTLRHRQRASTTGASLSARATTLTAQSLTQELRNLVELGVVGHGPILGQEQVA